MKKFRKLFYKIDRLDLIKQITTMAFLISLGAIMEIFCHFHFGIYEICFGTLLMALLIPLFVDWRISILGSFALITIGDFFISGDKYFWLNYLPLFFSIIIVEIGKWTRKLKLNVVIIMIAWIQFILVKTFLAYLVLGVQETTLFIIASAIQFAIGGPIIIIFYLSLYRVMVSMNRNIYLNLD